MSVEISLVYDYGVIENPMLRWQTGEVAVRAEDGDELLIQPEWDTVRIRLSVVDGFVDVPYEDVF